jgi:hypothetical protein
MSGKGDTPRHNHEAYRSAPYWAQKENLDQTEPVMAGPTSKSSHAHRDHGSEAQSGRALTKDK